MRAWPCGIVRRLLHNLHMTTSSTIRFSSLAQEVWTTHVVNSPPGSLLRSFFLFMLIAQTTQFVGCAAFSLLDLWFERIPLRKMVPTAMQSVLGFVPFIIMWHFEEPVLRMTIPEAPPSPVDFLAQFVFCGVVGDLLHYLTHRWLHVNATMRNNIHKVHHAYDGPLYSWIGMQVHPVEVTMITCAIYAPFIAFAHPLVLWTFAFLATINATVAHSGYEGGFASFGIPLALTSDDHQLHHDLNSTKNFGNILRVWDLLFATYGKNKKHPALSIWKMANKQMRGTSSSYE